MKTMVLDFKKERGSDVEEIFLIDIGSHDEGYWKYRPSQKHSEAIAKSSPTVKNAIGNDYL